MIGESYCHPISAPQKVGDTVRWRPAAWYERGDFPLAPSEVTGRVIYVNEAHRFYTVEARLGEDRLRESFRF